MCENYYFFFFFFGGGGSGQWEGGCGWERRIEAFVKIKKKKFFFGGGSRGEGGVGLGGSGWM